MGASFQHFGDQVWTPAGTEKGNQNGSPSWARLMENILFENKSGGHFGSLKFGVREPSHTARRGEPAASLFFKCEPQARVRAVSLVPVV